MQAGQGVARAIKEGIVKREDLFIVSKLWNTFHKAEQVEIQCRRQLKDWGLQYFDLCEYNDLMIRRLTLQILFTSLSPSSMVS